VSPKIFPLPGMVLTLSGVWTVVAKRPISSTVPVHAGSGNEVPDLERLQNHEKYPAGKVRKQSRLGHANCDTCRCNRCREAGGLAIAPRIFKPTAVSMAVAVCIMALRLTFMYFSFAGPC
jgi:hypothetical protein